jgi:hypothetical protein
MKNQFPVAKILPMLQPDVAEKIRELVPDVDNAIFHRKGTGSKAEQIADGEYAVVQYVSTREVDRDREVLVPKGCILDEFKMAPQVLWGHNYSMPPVGRDEWIKSDDFGIKAKTVYAVDEYEQPGVLNMARLLYNLRKSDFLSTSSVGFIPIEYCYNGGENWMDTVKQLCTDWSMKPKQFEKVSCIYTKWLLLEHSDVSVPANIGARTLAKSFNIPVHVLKQSGADDIEDMEDSDPPAPVVSGLSIKAFAPTATGLPEAQAVPVVRACPVVTPTPREMDVKSIVDEVIARIQGRV